MSTSANISKNLIWRGLFSIAIGVILIIWPGITLKYLMKVIGVLIMVPGVVALISYYNDRSAEGKWGLGFPVAGLVCVVFGLLLVVMPSAFAVIFIVILGLLLVLAAADQIFMLLQAKKRGYMVPAVRYVVPAFVLVVGIIIVFNPFETTRTVFILFGIAAVMYGLSDLLGLHMINSKKENQGE